MEQCVHSVAQEMVNSAKSKRMMTDNITLIIVALNRGIENGKHKITSERPS